MITQSVRDELAPSGTLRLGINYGNAVLASRDAASGELRGVAVDLARELERRCELPVELVAFESAGKMTAALKTGAWDAAFLAVEPGRAGEIAFTAPYLLIEGTYLIPPGSPIHSIADVDRAGVRVGASTGSAYDLYLSRNLQQAQMIKAVNPNTAFRSADRRQSRCGRRCQAGADRQCRETSRVAGVRRTLHGDRASDGHAAWATSRLAILARIYRSGKSQRFCRPGARTRGYSRCGCCTPGVVVEALGSSELKDISPRRTRRSRSSE